MPQTWTGKEDIRAINKAARTSALKLLSLLAAIRLEDYADKIQTVLIQALAEPSVAADKFWIVGEMFLVRTERGCLSFSRVIFMEAHLQAMKKQIVERVEKQMAEKFEKKMTKKIKRQMAKAMKKYDKSI